MTTFAERLKTRMEPWNVGPKVGGLTDLDRYLKAIAVMYEPFLELCEEEGEDGRVGYIPAWGKLFNPTECPKSGLAYLGLYVGVPVPTGATETEARQLVKEHAGFERGTLAALEGAVRRILEETRAAFPTGLSVADSFKRANEKPLSNAGKWEAITGVHDDGQVSGEGWETVESFPLVSGALWNAKEQTAPAVSALISNLPPNSEQRRVAVWGCLSKVARSGYRACWEVEETRLPTAPLRVTVEKWEAGSKTILGSVANQTLLEGDSIGIGVSEGLVRAWRKTAGVWSQVVEGRNDTTFSSGYTGIEMAGLGPKLNNFSIGEAGRRSTNFKILERTGPSAEELAYYFVLIVPVGKITNALYEAINAVIPAGIWYKIEESKNAWIAGAKKWENIAAGVKWNKPIVEGEY